MLSERRISITASLPPLFFMRHPRFPFFPLRTLLLPLQEAIRERIKAVRVKLSKEVVARDASIRRLQESWHNSFEQLEGSLKTDILTAFRKKHDEVPGLLSTLDQAVQKEELFYESTVPELNEAMCGEHIRDMQHKREALELNNVTVSEGKGMRGEAAFPPILPSSECVGTHSSSANKESQSPH